MRGAWGKSQDGGPGQRGHPPEVVQVLATRSGVSSETRRATSARGVCERVSCESTHTVPASRIAKGSVESTWRFRKGQLNIHTRALCQRLLTFRTHRNGFEDTYCLISLFGHRGDVSSKRGARGRKEVSSEMAYSARYNPTPSLKRQINVSQKSGLAPLDCLQASSERSSPRVSHRAPRSQ